MSKLSKIHAELEEQAAELGFESIEQAEANGYIVEYSGEEAFLVPNTDRELEKAHEAWLQNRDRILHWLEKLSRHLESHKPHDIFGGYLDYEITDMAIDFIKEAHD